MNIEVPTGRYILAVSGGVDSMVLLDLLAKHPGIELVVAHFNHGIRPDSDKDEELVRAKTKQLGVPFEVGYGHLGKTASEATARQARYDFLEKILDRYQAKAIITAHHQDDWLETAILNLLRGTGYKGLVSISANKKVIRPLLGYPKKMVLNYAKKNRLEWRDDSSNQDDSYLRNYVRYNILPKLNMEQRKEFICNIDKVAKIDKILNQQIAKLSHNISDNSKIDRRKFNTLPTDLANELLAYWLRGTDVELDKFTITRLNIALRTSKAGTMHPVKDNLAISLSQQSAKLVNSL